MIYEIKKLRISGPGEYYEHLCYFKSDKGLSEFKELINSQYKYGQYEIHEINVLNESCTLVNSILDSGVKNEKE